MLNTITSFLGYDCHLFQSLFARACFSVITAFFSLLLLQNRFVEFLKKKQFLEKVNNHHDKLYDKHKDKNNTPTMGGLLIIVSVLWSVFLWINSYNFYIQMSLFVLFYFGAVGFFDDRIKCFNQKMGGFSIRRKLFLELCGALIIGLCLYFHNRNTLVLSLPFFKSVVISLGLFYVFLALLIVVLSCNAVNLTDGLDGLATGILIISYSVFFVLTYLSGHTEWSRYFDLQYVEGAGEIAILCSSVVGACLGFLWFNAYPASVFMGDTGSLPLGALLSAIALFIRQELLFFLVCGVFILEGFSSFLQIIYYKMTGKRFFLIAPLHHHFQMKNISENKIVIRFWILALLLGLSSLLILKMR